jgi:hypothetical protein
VVVKRKTRRGSRGGKNRRKKPAAGVAVAAADGAVAVGAVTVEIERPEEDGRADGLPELAAVAMADAVVEPEPVAEAAAPEPDESAGAVSDAPDYVPMSEWLDDFDRR